MTPSGLRQAFGIHGSIGVARAVGMLGRIRSTGITRCTAGEDVGSSKRKLAGLQRQFDS